jgi:hypothetical protein
MHNLAHQGCHDCGPKAWRNVPNVTGDYDLDATILHRNNPNLPARLKLYVKTKLKSYGPKGYAGYGPGDD